MQEMSSIEESEDVPGSILPVTSDVEGEEEIQSQSLPLNDFVIFPVS